MTTDTIAPDAPTDEPPAGPAKRDKSSRSLFDPAIMRRALLDSLRKLDPRLMARNPVMFVVEVGAVATTLIFLRDLGSSTQRRERRSPAWSPRGCGSPCCSPTSPRPWPRVGARPRPTPSAHARSDTTASVRRADGTVEQVPSPAAPGRRRVHRRRRRGHPRRRRDHRGHRPRRRVGHHRRVGSGHPRVGWRPLGGHRRHPGAVRPDRRAHHRQARRDLPRPDDRPRRGGQPPEDPERDRAQHPAGRPHAHLPARRRDAAALRHLLRRRAVDHRAGRPARLPHPDDDRRAALRHRHRRHGPAGAAQRARHVGPGRRGGRRLLDAAARQDRHHHARQPPGRPRSSRCPASPSRSWPTRPCSRASPTRPRKAARSSFSPRSSTASPVGDSTRRPS